MIKAFSDCIYLGLGNPEEWKDGTESGTNRILSMAV